MCSLVKVLQKLWWSTGLSLLAHTVLAQSAPSMPPLVDRRQMAQTMLTPHDGALQQGTEAKWLSLSCLAPHPIIMIKSAKVKCFMVGDLRQKTYDKIGVCLHFLNQNKLL